MKADTIYNIDERTDTEIITDFIEHMDDADKKKLIIFIQGVKMGKDLNKNREG